MKQFLIIVFLAIVTVSCTKNESEIIKENESLEIAQKNNVREPGQIPKNINLLSKMGNVQENAVAHVALLKELKQDHGSTDYYNNLFELSSSGLFESEDFSNLGAEELKFLLDEMRSVNSNMVNIKNIPILMNAALKANVIANEEYLTIAEELITKNEKEISSLNWKNKEILSEKLEEIEKAKYLMYYPRARY